MNDQEEDTHCNILHCHFACIEATLLSPMDNRTLYPVPSELASALFVQVAFLVHYVFLYHVFSFITMYAELL